MRGERGSILPLGIGILALTVVVILFFAERIGVEFQTIQNKQLADVTALQIASDLSRDGIAPVQGLDYLPAAKTTLETGARFLGLNPSQVSISSPDGKTIYSTVCTHWRSITGLTFNLFGEVCASSKARAVN
jgi:hypothetical protein